MKVTFNAKEFVKAGGIASKAISRRSTIPVIGMIRLDVNSSEGSLTIHGQDLDTYITAKIDAEADADFSVLINPKSSLRFLRGEAGTASISLMPHSQSVKIEASGCSLEKRQLIPVEDWPLLEDCPRSEAPVTISSDAIGAALKHVRPCMCTEETRYYLSGAYFHAVDGQLCVVATDGHRLAKFDFDTSWAFEPAIIRTDVIDILSGPTRAGGNIGVEIDVSDSHSRFAVGDVAIVSKSILATYPNYKRAIPEPSEEIRTTVSAAQISRFPDDREPIKIHPERGFITARNVVSEETITVPATGSGGEFGLKLKYLRDFLKVSSTVSISGARRGDPFRILPENPKCLWILMPMRV